MYFLSFNLLLILFSINVNAQDFIRIGAPLPLTGPLSLEANKQKRGYELWAEQVNKAGGIKVGEQYLHVKIIDRDYQSDSQKARQAVQSLVDKDDVHFLFAPYGSKATREASPVAHKFRTPMIAATASSSQAYARGHRYIFGTFTPNSTLIEPISNLVKQSFPEIKNCALIIRNDLFPLSLARDVGASLKKKNIEIVFYEKYEIEESNHIEALKRLKGLAPDWIFAVGYTKDLILVRQQMAELGISANVMTMIAAPAYREFIDATGSLAENISSASWWHPEVRYKGQTIFSSTENFVKLFTKKYHSIPDYVEASAALAGALFQLAIERANSLDGESVRNELANINETTFFGPVRFGENGQNESLAPPIFQIQNAKAVIVYPFEIASGVLKVNQK